MRRTLPPPRHLAERYHGRYLIIDQAFNMPEGPDFQYRDQRQACMAAWLLDCSHALALARIAPSGGERQQTPAEVA